MKVHMPLLERAHSRESCGLQFESRPVLFRALKSQGGELKEEFVGSFGFFGLVSLA
jgi:hypothetical protein